MQPNCYKNNEIKGQIAKITEFLKVISEENRLKILCILKKEEKCVCEIWQYLDLPQNLTSHHLKVLKDFGLIKSKKEGLKVFYSIDQNALANYLKSFNQFLTIKNKR